MPTEFPSLCACTVLSFLLNQTSVNVFRPYLLAPWLPDRSLARGREKNCARPLLASRQGN